MAGTVHGDVEVGDGKICEVEMLEQSLLVDGEVDDVATVIADSVVVWLSLYLVARFGFTEVEFLYESSGYKRLEVTVNGDEVDVGKGSMNILGSESRRLLLEGGEDFFTVFGEAHRRP